MQAVCWTQGMCLSLSLQHVCRWILLTFTCFEIIKALEYFFQHTLSIVSVHFRLHFEQSTCGLAFFSVPFLQPSNILGQQVWASQEHFASIHWAVKYVSFHVFDDLEVWWNTVIHYVHFCFLMSCDGRCLLTCNTFLLGFCQWRWCYRSLRTCWLRW